MTAPRPPRDCRAARDRMPLRYYDALAPAERGLCDRHIESCADCAGEWAALRAALDAADPATVFPREARVDWKEFARLTVARARAAEAAERACGRAPDRGGPLRRWTAWTPGARRAAGSPAVRWAALAAAAVALVLLGLWVRPGPERTAVGPRPGEEGPGDAARASLLESAHAIEDRLARRGAARYLSDSRSVLVNLVGTAAPCRKADGRYDVALEREKSRQLLRRKNLYEGELLALEDRRIATLVGQLESVLMQVASLDDCATARQIHDLREQIEARQILMRIDLVTREMQGRAHAV